MKLALKAYDVDDNTINNFADKLIWRMQKVIDNMDVKNPQYLKLMSELNIFKNE